jgi:cardiolipin synthase (CMP-forming)
VLLAAVTDTIDGTLARRFGTADSVGAYFDPIVDKLFLSAVYICLAMISTVPWWLVIEIFTRDVVILASSGTLLLLDRRRRFPPSVWGKASTFLQIGCALAILVNNAFPGAVASRWQYALFVPVAAVTAFSGIHYLWRGGINLRSEGPVRT